MGAFAGSNAFRFAGFEIAFVKMPFEGAIFCTFVKNGFSGPIKTQKVGNFPFALGNLLYEFAIIIIKIKMVKAIAAALPDKP